MKPFPITLPAIATAILSMALITTATSASAQSAGPRGPGGPHMSGAEMGAPQMSRHGQRMMLLYDTNKDGKISVAEINGDQARIFTAMDVDGDRSLSVDELKRRGRSLQIFRTTTIFDLLDVNGDGKLSVAEVNAPSKRWFKRYDANNDGIMEASEIPEGRHHSRRGRRGRR
ncbi:MAG: hypothetical protein HOM58_13040 [Rhodospirillaceae bacterium]|jgi:hypothetical protein|nr:hypothetical protein [Rhodospirillaceae bacterium]MBT5455659.1 hypothetical protein [Rhodospirillaceae bacterium]